MICLARSTKSFRPILRILHRPTVATTTLPTAVFPRAAYRHASGTATNISNNGDTVAYPKEAKSMSVKARKKAIRAERRAKEKAEAKIPGTEAFLKAKLKAEKHAKKEARKARIAAGEPLTDEADIKAEEQAERDREQLAKRRAEPVTRQARRKLKQDMRENAGKTPEELREAAAMRFKIDRTKQTRAEFFAKMTKEKMSRLRSPDYVPRVYKTKEEYDLERSQRRRRDYGTTQDGSDGVGSTYNSRVEKSLNSTEESLQDFVGRHFDRNIGSAKPAGTSFSHSDRPQHRTREIANKRPWDNRGNGDDDFSSESNRRQDFHDRSEIDTRDFDFTEKSRRSAERGGRTETPLSSRSRSVSPYAEREPWMVQKEAVKRKIGGAAWAPPKRLSPDTLEAIRTMHKSDPDKFSTPILAQQFKQSPEVIRRILRTKWQPSEEEVLDRQKRWERRGEKIWTKQAELGVRPPKKWREMGVAKVGEPGVAPRYKKNAHANDRYSERQNYGEAEFRKPFSARIL